MCERETFSGYVLFIYNKVFFAGSSSVIGIRLRPMPLRIVHDYNGLVCCKCTKEAKQHQINTHFFAGKIFGLEKENFRYGKSFLTDRKTFIRNGEISHPESTPENTHGLSQKIQGTYFKISALYFKIYGLYF